MTAFRDIIAATRRPDPTPRSSRPLAAPWRPMRQKQIVRWATQAARGYAPRGNQERAMRLLVEALELARAAGLNEAQMQAVLRTTFQRQPGQATQAAGATGVALLLLCETLGIDADETEVAELNRILALAEAERTATRTPAAPAAAATPAAPQRAAEPSQKPQPSQQSQQSQQSQPSQRAPHPPMPAHAGGD